MFKIVETKPFIKEIYNLFDYQEINKYFKFKRKVKINPFIGKGLRVNYVREFKTNKGKRAYFIVYFKFNLVLFVASSNKKEQKVVIEKIFNKLDEFYMFAEKIYYETL